MFHGKTQKSEPCETCDAESECAVWGHRVCYPCVNRWEDAVKTRSLKLDGETLSAFSEKYFTHFRKKREAA